MKQCDMAIARLIQENGSKDDEIRRKKRILEILKQKAERIAQQRQAVQKYQDFLEEVRSNNPDQYNSINNIMNKH